MIDFAAAGHHQVVVGRAQQNDRGLGLLAILLVTDALVASHENINSASATSCRSCPFLMPDQPW
jgi:hypothetical protein